MANFKLDRNMQNYESWYFRNRSTFRLLRKYARDLLIKSISIQQHASIVNVQGRVKDLESFKEKMSGKEYTKPEQIEDIVGLRIIVYTLSDYITAYEVVKQNFRIIENKMVTKKSGYKARHLIVGFDENRLRLFEYRQFKGLRFEIQLCTILEHAWNESSMIEDTKVIYPLSYIESFLCWLKIYIQLTKSSKGLLLDP